MTTPPARCRASRRPTTQWRDPHPHSRRGDPRARRPRLLRCQHGRHPERGRGEPRPTAAPLPVPGCSADGRRRTPRPHQDQGTPPSRVDWPDDPIARISLATDVGWSTFHQPYFVASMELWVAARTNENLRTALLPTEREIGKTVREAVAGFLGPELTSSPRYADLYPILFTSMRGAATTYLIDRRDPRHRSAPPAVEGHDPGVPAGEVRPPPAADRVEGVSTTESRCWTAPRATGRRTPPAPD